MFYVRPQLLIAEKTLDTLLPNTFTMFKKKKASTDDYQVSVLRI